MGEGVQQATGLRFQHLARITAGMGSRDENNVYKIEGVGDSSVLFIECLR
jgi:hypothetical protein